MKNDNNQPDTGYMIIQIGWGSKFCFPYVAGESYLRGLASADQIIKNDDHWEFAGENREEVKVEFMTTENYNIMKAYEIIKPGEDEDNA